MVEDMSQGVGNFADAYLVLPKPSLARGEATQPEPRLVVMESG